MTEDQSSTDRRRSVNPRDLIARRLGDPGHPPDAIPPATPAAGARGISLVAVVALFATLGLVAAVAAVLLPRWLDSPPALAASSDPLPPRPPDPLAPHPPEPSRGQPAPGFLIDGSVMATPYQAVVLVGGQTLYGRLDRSGDAWPLLTDVYLIRQAVDPSTKKVTNTLIRRLNEPHGPDRMAINPAQILFVEPIHTDSEIARLILAAKKPQPGSPTPTPP